MNYNIFTTLKPTIKEMKEAKKRQRRTYALWILGIIITLILLVILFWPSIANASAVINCISSNGFDGDCATATARPTRVHNTKTPTDLPPVPTDTNVPDTATPFQPATVTVTEAFTVTKAPTMTNTATKALETASSSPTAPKKSTFTSTPTISSTFTSTFTPTPTTIFTATNRPPHIDYPSLTPTRTATLDAPPYLVPQPTCDLCNILSTLAAAQSTQAAAQSTLASSK